MLSSSLILLCLATCVAATMSAATATAVQTQVLAPASVTRLSGQATEVRADVWEVTMGEAVAAFVLANGPAKITSYNFLQLRGAKVDSALVSRRAVEAPSGQVQEKHDLADIFDVTSLGRSKALAKPNKQVPLAAAALAPRGWRAIPS